MADHTGGYRIELYSLRPARPKTYIFRKTLVKGGPMAEILRDPSADPPRYKRTSEEVIGAVIKQRNAVDFVRAHCQFRLDARVHALGIAKDSQSPPVFLSPNTIAGGTYPVTDVLTLYLHPDAPPVAREFCEFATGPDGTQIVKEFGLWPEVELEQARTEQRVADAKSPITSDSQPATHGLGQWLSANAVPVGLSGLGVVAIVIMFGSVALRRNA